MKVINLLFGILLVFLSSNIFSQTFTNVAQQIGLTCTYNDRFYYIPGGGIGFADMDNDNDPDCIIATDVNFKVFRNDNGFFTDITSVSGISFFGDALKSVLWGDFNNDGLRDVYLTSWYSNNRLYKNTGNNSFVDVTALAGVSMPNFNYQSTTASWGDIDRDGFLDLYVGNYGNIEGQGNQYNILFKNNGNGTFTDITNSAGVADSLAKKPLVITMFDYDADGWQDIYIAMDKFQRSTLFRNNGNSTFTDVSLVSGTGISADAMGLAVTDFNRDSWLDIYVSNGTVGNFLLKNNGNGTFSDIAGTTGTRVYKECWGNNFLDYDNNNWQDLFVTASSGIDMCDVLLNNNGNNTFTNIGYPIGIKDSAKSHGSAVCDYNMDGYPDFFVTLSDSNLKAFRNNGGQNNWIKIKCIGVQSNKDAIGSTVTVFSGGAANKQVILGANSFLSQDDVVLIFGLGSVSIVDSINIKWTNGLSESVGTLAVNSLYSVKEGSGVIGIQTISSLVPENFELYQNYPNPFNPLTNIRFSIPTQGYVSLKIFDISGREVAVLFNGDLKAGTYNVDFNASNLSSSLYLYVLSAGGNTFAKKMILIK